jgi:hypothetical protein
MFHPINILFFSYGYLTQSYPLHSSRPETFNVCQNPFIHYGEDSCIMVTVKKPRGALKIHIRKFMSLITEKLQLF